MSENCLKQNNGRLVSLDIIKLVSAFMIVFYHLDGYLKLGSFATGSYQISLAQIVMSLCSCSVPLFFMVNGALLLNREYTTEKIYIKAAKVALIIFVWQIVAFPNWFMKTLIILFLLYPILNKLDKAKNKIWRNLVMLAFFIFPFLYNLVMVCLQLWLPDFSIVILGKTLSLQTLPLRSGFYTLYAVLYFLIGGVMFRKKISNIAAVISLIAGWALVIFDVIVSSNYAGTIQDAVNTCFPTVGAMLISIGIFNLFRNFDDIKSEKFRKVVSNLGQYVLPIYLFHLQIVWKIYVHILPARLNIILVVLLALLDCVVCVIAGMILKKIPLVKELLKM